MYMDRTDLRTKTYGQITFNRKRPKQEKIPPTPGFEPQVK